METKILLEELSPYGNIVAIVEELNNAIYLYLYGPADVIPLGENPDSWKQGRSCWVCNTHPISDTEVDMPKILEAMEHGLPPTMPAKYCRHARTGLKLAKDDLTIVWFEECDCAALLHRGETIAVIPPWATSAISGYSREFQGKPFLGVGSFEEISSIIEQRIKKAQAFWHRWSQPETWGNFLYKSMEVLESYFGKSQSYFAIDGERFPPKGLAVFEKDNTSFFITIGMSVLAQPRIELYTEHPEQSRRVELGIAVDKSVLKQTSIEDIVHFISSTASMPWDQLCWFAHGHTLNCELFTHIHDQFNNTLFIDKGLNSIVFPSHEGDPVKLLWLVPLTDKEFVYQQAKSSEDLIKKLEKIPNVYVFKPRLSLV